MKPAESPLEDVLRKTISNGSRLLAESDGRAYRVSHINPPRGTLTLQREIPKVRGKAARREDKHRRQQERKARMAVEIQKQEVGAVLEQILDHLKAVAERPDKLAPAVRRLEDYIKQLDANNERRHEALMRGIQALEGMVADSRPIYTGAVKIAGIKLPVELAPS